MEAFHLACVLLSLSTGEIFGYEIQPVDAVLFIDGAPTYLRLTNSTSLEDVYACILEKSRSVDSAVMAAQMRGLILDVGEVEENVGESILRLPERTGQSLWKTEEDAETLKARLARFLTMDHHGSRIDPGAYRSSKFQRSTGWPHGEGQPRRELSSATPEYAKESLALPANHTPFLDAAKTNRTSSLIWTSISPTEGTITKSSSVITKRYPSPATATMFEHIPARPSELNSSSKPFSSDEYVKTERAKSWNGSDITSDVGKEPEKVRHALGDTSDNGRDPFIWKALGAGRAPSPEFKNVVRDPDASHAFNRILTETGDVSDRTGSTSSDTGSVKTVMVPGEGEIGAKKRASQKKSAGEKEKKRPVAGDHIH